MDTNGKAKSEVKGQVTAVEMWILLTLARAVYREGLTSGAFSTQPEEQQVIDRALPWLYLGILILKQLVMAFGTFLVQIRTLQINKPV